MDDILKLTVEDFFGIYNVIKEKNEAMSGKKGVKTLKSSQKEMIRKAKENK